MSHCKNQNDPLSLICLLKRSGLNDRIKLRILIGNMVKQDEGIIFILGIEIIFVKCIRLMLKECLKL